MTVKDITKELTNVRVDLYGHRVKVGLGQEQTNDKINKMKRYVARMLTLLEEKKRAALTGIGIGTPVKNEEPVQK